MAVGRGVNVGEGVAIVLEALVGNPSMVDATRATTVASTSGKSAD